VARGALLLHAEIDATVTDKFVQLFEGAFVQQKVDALARRELPRIVFALAALRAAASLGFIGNAPQFLHAVGVPVLWNQAGLRLRQAVLPRKGNPLAQKCAPQDAWLSRWFRAAKLHRGAIP